MQYKLWLWAYLMACLQRSYLIAILLAAISNNLRLYRRIDQSLLHQTTNNFRQKGENEQFCLAISARCNPLCWSSVGISDLLFAALYDRAINPSVRLGPTGGVSTTNNYQLCNQLNGPAGAKELITCNPPHKARWVSFHLDASPQTTRLHFHEIEIHGSCED